jgi:hypothetical protein
MRIPRIPRRITMTDAVESTTTEVSTTPSLAFRTGAAVRRVAYGHNDLWNGFTVAGEPEVVEFFTAKNEVAKAEGREWLMQQ